MKIVTFNFTKYGLIDAEVVDIGNDAVVDQQTGLVFKMRLALDQNSIAAEIKTGRRRLIEFFEVVQLCARRCTKLVVRFCISLRELLDLIWFEFGTDAI